MILKLGTLTWKSKGSLYYVGCTTAARHTGRNLFKRNNFCDLCVKVLVDQLCLTLCDPMDCNSPGSSVHRIFQAIILSGFPCPPPWDFPNPGTEPRSPTLQADSFPAEPQGRPKNTGVGSLFFSSGSSQPRNQTGVPYIAGRFFKTELPGKPSLP